MTPPVIPLPLGSPPPHTGRGWGNLKPQPAPASCQGRFPPGASAFRLAGTLRCRSCGFGRSPEGPTAGSETEKGRPNIERRKNDEPSKPSPGPWTLKLDGLIRDAHGNIIVVCYNFEDAEHIIGCVS